uniref:OSJNBa0088K19.11 protein n=1 Tax=Oryza sativa subsp. japonica TaxID=39947 RepID=Q7XUZ5_ORYSJ|nr:OSJNBa0088K19.11 [Oryza sativa Japonica Group]CAD41026.1 OSJNBb0086G13.4 [Oryza sativa Japonica Group]
MMTGAGEEATRAAGSGCTETRTACSTPLQCRRQRRRREMTSRRGGTMMTTTNTGGVRSKGRRGRGRPCCSDAGGGDGDVGRRTGTAEEAAEGDVDEEEGEAGAGDGVPVKQRSSWRRGQRCDVDGGDGDVQEPTEDGEVLDADEEATPASFGRGGGDAGDEGGVAEPREVVATSTGAQAGRQRRLEVDVTLDQRAAEFEARAKELDARARSGGAAAGDGDLAARLAAAEHTIAELQGALDSSAGEVEALRLMGEVGPGMLRDAVSRLDRAGRQAGLWGGRTAKYAANQGGLAQRLSEMAGTIQRLPEELEETIKSSSRDLARGAVELVLASYQARDPDFSP